MVGSFYVARTFVKEQFDSGDWPLYLAFNYRQKKFFSPPRLPLFSSFSCSSLSSSFCSSSSLYFLLSFTDGEDHGGISG